MPRLTEAQKEFIVDRLAMFGKPSEIAEAVKEEFKVEIPRQQVEEYDPEKRCKTPKWVERHAATRKAFLERKAGLAISHRSWRMAELEDMARKAKKQKNYKLAAELLEQAAREDGDSYVNHRSKEAPVESEEAKIDRIRSSLTDMDERTIGPPTSPPTLTLEKKTA